MSFNLVKINNTCYKVHFMEGVGYYVDVGVEGQAVTKPTNAELYEELKRRYPEVEIAPSS